MSALQFCTPDIFFFHPTSNTLAMILATAVTMGLSTLGGYTAGPAGGFAPDGRAIAVFVLLGLVHCGYKKIRQKAPSPIGMILLSAVLGIVFWH